MHQVKLDSRGSQFMARLTQQANLNMPRAINYDRYAELIDELVASDDALATSVIANVKAPLSNPPEHWKTAIVEAQPLIQVACMNTDGLLFHAAAGKGILPLVEALAEVNPTCASIVATKALAEGGAQSLKADDPFIENLPRLGATVLDAVTSLFRYGYGEDKRRFEGKVRSKYGELVRTQLRQPDVSTYTIVQLIRALEGGTGPASIDDIALLAECVSADADLVKYLSGDYLGRCFATLKDDILSGAHQPVVDRFIELLQMLAPAIREGRFSGSQQLFAHLICIRDEATLPPSLCAFATAAGWDLELVDSVLWPALGGPASELVTQLRRCRWRPLPAAATEAVRGCASQQSLLEMLRVTPLAFEEASVYASGKALFSRWGSGNKPKTVDGATYFALGETRGRKWAWYWLRFDEGVEPVVYRSTGGKTMKEIKPLGAFLKTLKVGLRAQLQRLGFKTVPAKKQRSEVTLADGSRVALADLAAPLRKLVGGYQPGNKELWTKDGRSITFDFGWTMDTAPPRHLLIASDEGRWTYAIDVDAPCDEDQAGRPLLVHLLEEKVSRSLPRLLEEISTRRPRR